MPNKRHKHQSLNTVVNILKRVGRNKEGHSATTLQMMLQAAERLMIIDDIVPAKDLAALNNKFSASGNPSGLSAAKATEVQKINVNDMLSNIKAKTGGSDATTESSKRENGSGLRKEMDP